MTTTDLRPASIYDEPEGSDEIIVDAQDDIDDDEATDAPSAAEREVKGELVQGELAGRTIYVKPVKAWRASALHSLREGDFDVWAEITLDDDDYDIWIECDPTLGEIEDFFASVNKGLGTNPGNSRASRRSAARTRKR